MIRLWLPVADDEYLPVDFTYAYQADHFMRRWHLNRNDVLREQVRRDAVVRGLSFMEAEAVARQGRVVGAHR